MMDFNWINYDCGYMFGIWTFFSYGHFISFWNDDTFQVNGLEFWPDIFCWTLIGIYLVSRVDVSFFRLIYVLG